MKKQTIYAVASATGKAGVSVIRVSGPNAMECLKVNCGFCGEVEPRKTYLRKVYGQDKKLIDTALVIYFKAPHSFTGEDVVELHVHGGRIIVEETLFALSQLGDFRMAEPGEFTKRAFYNNRMDLTEAEALADLIDAQTKAQKEQALKQMNGALKDLYMSWRQKLVEKLSHVEAYIDFPEEDIPSDVVFAMQREVNSLIAEIQDHLNDGRRGEILRDGFKVAILGKPNAGKSSLMNKIAQRDVAIVSTKAGTTRDIIDVSLDIKGYPVVVSDTAGIRETDEEIELEGVKRAFKLAEKADLILLMVDARDKIDETLALLSQGALQNIQKILVINKLDLLEKPKEFKNNPFESFYVSVKEEKGLAELLVRLGEVVEERMGQSEAPAISRIRYREKLLDAVANLQQFDLTKPIELVSEDLRGAVKAIGEITGVVNVDELLDNIFSKFCIGK